MSQSTTEALDPAVAKSLADYDRSRMVQALQEATAAAAQHDGEIPPDPVTARTMARSRLADWMAILSRIRRTALRHPRIRRTCTNMYPGPRIPAPTRRIGHLGPRRNRKTFHSRRPRAGGFQPPAVILTAAKPPPVEVAEAPE